MALSEIAEAVVGPVEAFHPRRLQRLVAGIILLYYYYIIIIVIILYYHNGSLQGMARRSDCSDFGVPNLIRLLYSSGPGSIDTDPRKREQLKQGILGWQYWIDQLEGTKPDNHFEGGMEG